MEKEPQTPFIMVTRSARRKFLEDDEGQRAGEQKGNNLTSEK
jgi:hypothetical protein